MLQSGRGRRTPPVIPWWSHQWVPFRPRPRGAAGAQKEASATLNTDIQMLVSQRYRQLSPFFTGWPTAIWAEADAQDAVQEAAYKAISRCRSCTGPEWIDTQALPDRHQQIPYPARSSRQSGDDILEQIPPRINTRTWICRRPSPGWTRWIRPFITSAFSRAEAGSDRSDRRQPLSRLKKAGCIDHEKTETVLTEEETQNE